MIYFPLEAQYGQTGWADIPLRALGYNQNPSKLQKAIRQMFKMGTKKLNIEGTRVIPCALYEALDGTRKEAYVARVEPSSSGGRIMAEFLKKSLHQILDGN